MRSSQSGLLKRWLKNRPTRPVATSELPHAPFKGCFSIKPVFKTRTHVSKTFREAGELDFAGGRFYNTPASWMAKYHNQQEDPRSTRSASHEGPIGSQVEVKLELGKPVISHPPHFSHRLAQPFTFWIDINIINNRAGTLSLHDQFA
jgi:hypothetical protein